MSTADLGAPPPLDPARIAVHDARPADALEGGKEGLLSARIRLGDANIRPPLRDLFAAELLANEPEGTSRIELYIDQLHVVNDLSRQQAVAVSSAGAAMGGAPADAGAAVDRVECAFAGRIDGAAVTHTTSMPYAVESIWVPLHEDVGFQRALRQCLRQLARGSWRQVRADYPADPVVRPHVVEPPTPLP